MKLKCLIIDDEPLAHQILEKYISSLGTLEIVKKCSNALEAIEYLNQYDIDLIFLDIKMPDLTGIDFLKTLSKKPKIIITSAYSEYAIDSYEYSVTDYLLKPFSFERFLKAVNKVFDSFSSEKSSKSENVKDEKDFIFVKSDKINHKLYFDDIDYIEGFGNYAKFFTKKGMLVTSETLTNIENKLPEITFVRVHKSFIVSLNKIDQIEGNTIRIGNKSIPVGKYYKKSFDNILRKYNYSR